MEKETVRICIKKGSHSKFWDYKILLFSSFLNHDQKIRLLWYLTAEEAHDHDLDDVVREHHQLYTVALGVKQF